MIDPRWLTPLATPLTAYWRRCRGGGYWPENQGPWWAAERLMDLWLLLVTTGVLFGLGIVLWKAAVIGLLFTLLWNPGHAGLSIGRDPSHENASKKPVARFIAPLLDRIATPGGPAWCVSILSLDYGIRTTLVAAAGAALVSPWFALFALAGFLTGPIYALGWAIWDKGWHPVFMQPDPKHQGGHLVGEWINGGWLQAALTAVAWACT